MLANDVQYHRLVSMEKITAPNETDAVMMRARSKQVLGALSTGVAAVEGYRFINSGDFKDVVAGIALAGVAFISTRSSIRDSFSMYLRQRKEINDLKDSNPDQELLEAYSHSLDSSAM